MITRPNVPLSRRALVLAAALAAAALAAASCVGRGKNAPVPVERTTVRVVNQGFLDRHVYVYQGMARTRLGTVTGNSTQVLTIPPSIVTMLARLRFVADGIGGRAPVWTDEISVEPGDQVVLTIPPS